ncbi:Diaminopelargonic acid synthase (fragment) [Capnocytophaga canimorsus]|uniref:Diaminopelargonic acid synthase n=1 Tax=Capnocytophaga canimorsus TaxID=28188 RepID=A0A0B7IAG9_9FLAO
MAASGISFFTKAFEKQLIEVVRIPIPTEKNENLVAEKLKQIITEKDVAAFIFEPLVQGAAGMQMYAPKALDKLLQIAQKNGVITIADEVMTGFGKTGRTFACDYLQEKPDIICLSKALTGGTIPLAVTSASERIFEAFYDQDVNKALFHGHTFMANPTGCAIALEALHLLLSEEMQQNIKRIENQHQRFINKHKNNFKIENLRQLGVILAFELKTKQQTDYYGALRNQLYNFFISQGVILRPVGNSIYLLPPYIITNNQLDTVYHVLEKAIERFGIE